MLTNDIERTRFYQNQMNWVEVWSCCGVHFQVLNGTRISRLVSDAHYDGFSKRMVSDLLWEGYSDNGRTPNKNQGTYGLTLKEVQEEIKNTISEVGLHA